MAPMPLGTYDDLTAPSLRDPDEPYWSRVRARTHDADSPMPPTGTQDRLSPEELATLDSWIAHGAPRSEASCAAIATEGGEPAPPIDPSECEYDFELRAHGGSRPDDQTPFVVPQGDDTYACFNFAVPWDAEVDGLYFEPLIDDRRVVHHWSLTTVDQKLEPGSRSEGPCAQSLGRAPVVGWVPGAPSTVLPDNVGIRMASGTNTTFQLEIHYNNVARLPDVRDRSGVRVCATSKLRPEAAVPVTLGTPCLGPLCAGLPPGRSTASNTCVNTSTVGPAHVLWTAPHMHMLGRHLRSEIVRTDGSKQVLTDADYDFRDQQRYPSDLLIYPGDRVETTCTFDNDTARTVKFGEQTSDEMCFNFLLVWPAGSMGVLNLPGYCITPTL